MSARLSPAQRATLGVLSLAAGAAALRFPQALIAVAGLLTAALALGLGFHRLRQAWYAWPEDPTRPQLGLEGLLALGLGLVGIFDPVLAAAVLVSTLALWAFMHAALALGVVWMLPSSPARVPLAALGALALVGAGALVLSPLAFWHGLVILAALGLMVAGIFLLADAWSRRNEPERIRVVAHPVVDHAFDPGSPRFGSPGGWSVHWIQVRMPGRR